MSYEKIVVKIWLINAEVFSISWIAERSDQNLENNGMGCLSKYIVNVLYFSCNGEEYILKTDSYVFWLGDSCK